MASMAENKPIDLTEPDERSAPFVIAYIGLVISWLVGVLVWVYWWRGYA